MNCLLCSKPLGQETQDLGYRICHECRHCVTCGKDVSPKETNFCLDNKMPIKDAKCMSMQDVGTLEVQLELLNLRRLSTSCCVRISEMSFEQKYQFLRMMEDTAAIISVHLQTHKQELTAKLNKEKQDRDKATAKGEALTSSRPTSKPADSYDEKVIGWFMQTYGIKERKHAISELKNRDKAIAGMQKYGTPYEAAVEIVEQQFAKKYANSMPKAPEKVN